MLMGHGRWADWSGGWSDADGLQSEHRMDVNGQWMTCNDMWLSRSVCVQLRVEMQKLLVSRIGEIEDHLQASIQVRTGLGVQRRASPGGGSACRVKWKWKRG